MSTKTQRFSLVGILIWIICGSFFLYEFLLRTVVGTFEHEIMNSLNIGLVVFGIISSSAYQIAYGFMQLPVGFLTARFGLKKAGLFAALLCGIATFLFGMSTGAFSAISFRVLMGIGSAFGFICVLVAVYDWIPRKHIGLFIGLSQFIGTLGPMAAGAPLSLVESKGLATWNTVFYILGVVGVVIAILFFLFVRNNDRREDPTDVTIIQSKEPILKSLPKILARKETWFIALFSATVYFSIEFFSENEGKTFIQTYGYSADFSALMITLTWLGYGIGCPLLGFISDRIKRRRTVMIGASLTCVTGLSCMFYLTAIEPMLIIGCLLLGLGAAGQSLGFATIAEECQSQYVPAGLGFNNAILMLMTAISAPALGFLLSAISGSGGTTQADYHIMFTVVLALSALSVFISTFLIRETYCKPQREIHVVKRN